MSLGPSLEKVFINEHRKPAERLKTVWVTERGPLREETQSKHVKSSATTRSDGGKRETGGPQAQEVGKERK